MSPSKHLWSGDWERDSPEMPAAQPQRETPPPTGPQEPEPRRSRRTAIIVASVIVVLAAVGVALGLTLGGSSTNKAKTQTSAFTPRPFNGSGGSSIFPQTQQTTTSQTSTSTTPQTQTTPATVLPQQQAATPIGPSYNWLGAQVSATPNGVVVATVTIGGAADNAGIEPGDVISQVGSTTVGSIAQLQDATTKIGIGNSFKMTVDRGTTAVVITTTLNDLPTRQP